MKQRERGPGNRDQEGTARTGSAAGRSSCAAGLLTRRAKMLPREGNALSSRAPRRRGVALLEVVLALALFFSVGVVILGGLNTCLRSVRQLRLQATAADLAVTALSEIELGVLPPADAGPKAYDEPLQDWSWEIVAMPVEGTLATMEVSRIEIIIRNTAEGYSHRLYHLVPTGGGTSGTAAAASDAGGTP